MTTRNAQGLARLVTWVASRVGEKYSWLSGFEVVTGRRLGAAGVELFVFGRYSKTRPLEERRRSPSPFAAVRRAATSRRSLTQIDGLATIPRAAGQ